MTTKSLLLDIKASFDENDVGPEILPKLASIANEFFSKTLLMDNLKKEARHICMPK